MERVLNDSGCDQHQTFYSGNSLVVDNVDSSFLPYWIGFTNDDYFCFNRSACI